MTTNIILIICLGIFSYLFGSVNSAIIISKINNRDIRKLGSGNAGTLNMGRNFGFKIGILVFIIDVVKGIIPCLVCFFVFKDKGKFIDSTFLYKDLAIYFCGLCVVLGHIYPIFFHFKGGKGVATTIGVFLFTEYSYGFAWGIVVTMDVVAATLFIYFTEFGSMGSFIAITPSALVAFIRLNATYFFNIQSCLVYYIITSLFIFLICFFTWFAHRGNIKRMLEGDEHPTSIRDMFIKDKANKREKNKNNCQN